MTTEVLVQTATIHPFPVGGRRGLAARAGLVSREFDVAPAVTHDAWYHDDAVRQAEQAERPNH